MNHPIFGFKNGNSRNSGASECELCSFSIGAINTDQINKLATPIWSPNSFTTHNDAISVDIGNIQADFLCLYKPKINSKCPKIVKRAKTLMVKEAIRHGEKLTQYLNTPSCDSSVSFSQRYWSEKNYNMLLKAKEHWDPENVFNHCQSIGSKDNNCCPPDL